MSSSYPFAFTRYLSLSISHIEAFLLFWSQQYLSLSLSLSLPMSFSFSTPVHHLSLSLSFFLTQFRLRDGHSHRSLSQCSVKPLSFFLSFFHKEADDTATQSHAVINDDDGDDDDDDNDNDDNDDDDNDDNDDDDGSMWPKSSKRCQKCLKPVLAAATFQRQSDEVQKKSNRFHQKGFLLSQSFDQFINKQVVSLPLPESTFTLAKPKQNCAIWRWSEIRKTNFQKWNNRSGIKW